MLAKRFAASLLGLAWLVISGCASSPVGSYQDTGVYDAVLDSKLALAARVYDGPARNPVVIIHGFLGSRLEDPQSRESVWGDFSTATFGDANLKRLGLPMVQGVPLAGLESVSRPAGILDDAEIRVAGFSFRQPGYQLAVDHLTRAGYVDAGQPLPEGKKHPTLFTFAYDWRRDLPENAAKLHEFLLEKRQMLQEACEEEYGVPDYNVQFDIVAHSMGGLLARYYLMYGNQDLPYDPEQLPELDWRGTVMVDRLLVVGTPNDGYLDTFSELVEGLVLVRGAPRLPSGIIATFPSYYQMLPGASGGTVAVELENGGKLVPLNLFNPEVWIRNQWGLADPTNDRYWQMLIPDGESKTPKERQKIARDHLIKCLVRAWQFRRALSVPSTPPEGCLLLLFAGDAVNTASLIRITPDGKLGRTEYSSGDGKVLVSSARFDSLSREIQSPPLSRSPIRWHSIYHVGAAHMGFFSSDTFWTNARYNLLMQPTPEQRRIFKLNE